MARTPSPLQRAILNYVENEKGNLLIVARAGTGKTSTLEMIAASMPKNVSACFLAFNKAIATELSARLPFPASTFHAIAFRAVARALSSVNRGRRMQVDANKCSRIFDDLNRTREYDGARTATLKLVALMKASALLPDCAQTDLTAIMDHFDIEWDDESLTDDDITELARDVLQRNNYDTLTVDFDDMLYFVHLHNVRLETFDYVMVDEAQDTNEIQRIILRRMMGPRSRLIAVGDPAQAIYGFRGASHDSMDLIAQDFDCTRLPLSVSYRCPARVIAEAQRYVPDITARDGAPDGEVKSLPSYKLADFQDSDLLVCRNTAPLVTVAYRMLASRQPCKILGRDIGRGLTSLIKKLAGKRTTLAELPDKVLAYQERETETARKRRQDAKVQSIADKCDSILALIDGMTESDRTRGIPGLIAIIDSLFSDNGPNVTTLCTVHKSKGLEAPRVFILDPALMPSKYAKQEWQQQQEINLQYVAVTRALEALYYLDTQTITA